VPKPMPDERLIAESVASSMQPMLDPYKEAARLKRGRSVLAVVNALNILATKHDPVVVMDAARDWLAYMDRQVAHNDGAS